MRIKNSLKLNKSSPLFAILLAMMMTNTSINVAHALTANDVLNKMGADERTGYFAGVVDGLAQARWMKDKPDNSGIQCIYDWYYKGGTEQRKGIHAWFNRHLDKPSNTLLYTLIKKECGE